jgi:menaquinone-dependent protoporphyrinogen IX oxidase
MRMTQGPTKSSETIEYTDCNKVKEFGERVRTLNLTKILII